jgi:hypothetical protein
MLSAAFLPEGYQAPKSSNFYMKLQEGENKIRILTKPIMGWEDWIEKKPIRYRMEDKPKKSHDPKMPIKHFWSFVVWNHTEEQIQILHLTQVTIRNNIEALCNAPEWGAPFFYDIKIIKKGDKTSTEYLVNPLPHKPIDPYIVECFNERPCDLEAIFENADPFSPTSNRYTQGIFNHIETENLSFVPKEEIEKLKNILSECPSDYQEKLLVRLKNAKGVDKLEDLTPSLFESVKQAAIKERDIYQHLERDGLFPEISNHK